MTRAKPAISSLYAGEGQVLTDDQDTEVHDNMDLVPCPKCPPTAIEQGRMTLRRSAQRHAALLHTLGMVALGHAQPLQGLALLHLAHHLFPSDLHIRNSLAHAYLVNGEHDLALATLDRDMVAGHGSASRPSWTTSYLRAKALLASGRLPEAQTLFEHQVLPSIEAGV